MRHTACILQESSLVHYCRGPQEPHRVDQRGAKKESHWTHCPEIRELAGDWPSPRTLTPPLNAKAVACDGIEETQPQLWRSWVKRLVVHQASPCCRVRVRRPRPLPYEEDDQQENKQAKLTSGYTQLTIEEAMQHASQPAGAGWGRLLCQLPPCRTAAVSAQEVARSCVIV